MQLLTMHVDMCYALYAYVNKTLKCMHNNISKKSERILRSKSISLNNPYTEQQELTVD